MVVRSQHLLVSRRLFLPPWLSQMVDDPAVHGVEGWLDRRRLHAHGLGAIGLGLRHPSAAGAGVGICRDHGVRIRLHASHPGHIFRANGVAIIASYQEGGRLGPPTSCLQTRPRKPPYSPTTPHITLILRTNTS